MSSLIFKHRQRAQKERFHSECAEVQNKQLLDLLKLAETYQLPGHSPQVLLWSLGTEVPRQYQSSAARFRRSDRLSYRVVGLSCLGKVGKSASQCHACPQSEQGLGSSQGERQLFAQWPALPHLKQIQVEVLCPSIFFGRDQ